MPRMVLGGAIYSARADPEGPSILLWMVWGTAVGGYHLSYDRPIFKRVH